jgi:hypothetical protein
MLWAAVASTIVIALVAFGVSAAHAATGTVASVSLSIVSDGAAPFDADNNPGNDSGPANGVVRENDTVTYQWVYGVASAGDVTLQQALPAGMVWLAESATNCAEGAAAISADKRTLTCTFVNTPAGAGAYAVKAKVVGAANGAALATSVSSGAVVSGVASVVVSAAPKVDVRFSHYSLTPQVGTGANAGIPGFAFIYAVDMFSPVDPVKKVLGVESLTSPFTFQVQPPSNLSPGVPMFCGQTTLNGNVRPASNGGGTRGVIDSGSWACSQPGGPGTPITVTVTGADTTLDTYPTQTATGAPLPADRAYFALGAVQWWFPDTPANFPAGVNTVFRTQLTGFDPAGLSGQSNYGSGFAAGQAPGDACVVVGVNNCAESVIFRGAGQQYGYEMAMVTAGAIGNSLIPLPGQTTYLSGDAPLYPGTKYQVGLTTQASSLNVPSNNFWQCLVWDPALQTIDPTRPPRISIGGADDSLSNYVIEYGTTVYASDAVRKAATCGPAGDNAPGWFPSIAAAGGPQAVTAMRVKYLNPLNPGANGRSWAPMTYTGSAAPAATPIPTFGSFGADGESTIHSSYNPANNTGLSGVRGLAAEARVRNTAVWDAASAKPGDVRTVTVTPVVDNPVNPSQVVIAQDVRVTVTLPNPCVAYQFGSASLTPVGFTPADVGPDGVACTADDGAGAAITFDLGPWPTGTPVSPITLNTVFNPLIVVPATETVTSVISSVSDPVKVADRTSTAVLPVNAVAAFTVTKTSSASVVTPGVPFEYTIGWANHLPSDAGTAAFVDVLPYNGDARGTTGLTGLTVGTVTPSTGAITVRYTSDPSAAVAAAVVADPSGNTGIAWSTVKPATVTAIQFLTDDMSPGKVESATIQVIPGNLSRTGQLDNDVWGKASLIPTPITAAANVKVTSSAAELSGNVYTDVDYSFSKTTGDTAVGNPSVQITAGYAFGADGIDNGGAGDDVPVTTPIVADTDAAGNYDFPGVAPGKYTVAVTPPAGTKVAVSPTMPIALNTGATVTGKDFGLQTIIPASAAVNDEKNVAENSSGNTVDVLANDTISDASVVVEKTTTPAHGTVTIPANGSNIAYTPAAGFVGDDTFSYTIIDKARQESTATVTIHVLATVTASADTVSTPVGTAVTVSVLTNDVPATGLTVTGVSGVDAAAGAATVNPDGTITFTPTATFAGVSSFTYAVNDAAGQTSSAKVTVTVVPTAPTAADDAAKTGFGKSVTVTVLGNDSGTGVSVTKVGSTPDGSIVVNTDGTITFVPNAGFTGTASFPYTITDVVGQTATATVSVTVVAGPTAVDDDVTTGFEKPVTVTVLANDSGVGISTTTVGTSTDGTAVVNAAGTVTFTPNIGFTGDASFSYTITDGYGVTATATVTVHVLPKPVASGDAVTIPQDTPVDVSVLTNDTGSGIQVTSVSGSAEGTVAVKNAATVTFTPNPGATGAATFTYTITDDAGQTATATVTVTIVAKPVANSDTALTGLNTLVVVPVLGNDTGTAIALTTVGTSSNGTPVANADGTVSFTPAAGFTGVTTFDYTIIDGVGQTATGTVTVTVRGTPTAVDDTVIIKEGTNASNIPVLANDLGSNLSLDTVGSSSDGTVTKNADGTITFAPNTGFTGTATFTYTNKDDAGQASTATVTVMVIAKPVLVDDFISTAEGQPVTSTVAANDTGTDLQITGVGTSPNGTATFLPDRSVTFTPAAGFHGVTTVTYSVVDAAGQTGTATLHISVVQAPTAADANVKTGQVMPVTVALQALTTGTAQSVTAVGSSLNGTVTDNGDGTATFIPAAGFVGTTAFTYTVTDALGQTATGTITVDVIPAPVASPDTAATHDGAPVTVQAVGNDTGENIVITAVETTPNGTVVLNADGTVTFTPKAGFAGTAVIVYTITDDLGQNAVGTITITVTNTPPGPTPTPDSGTGSGVNTGGLARTGSDVSLFGIGLGILMLIGGAMALSIGFRRRRGTH